MASDEAVASKPVAPLEGARLALLVPTLIFVGLLVAIISSLGAPLIPTIAQDDHVSLSTAEWVLTAALMTGAVVTPVMGRLADGARQRAVISVTLVIVAAGCVLSAVSTSFEMLVVGRALQGMGLGLLPVNMAIARRNLDAQRAGQAIAVLSVSTAIGAGLGYPLTSLIAQVFDYRVAYWFGAFVVLAALLAALAVLPARSGDHRLHFDTPGALTLAIAVIGISVVLSEGGGWGWSSARSLGIMVLCAAMIALWVRRELTTEHPLVELRHLSRRPVLTADIAGFLMSLSMYLVLPTVVEFIQIPPSAGFGFGSSIVVAGLVLVPLSVGTFVASRFLVPYERRFGVRTMIPLGALVFSSASVFFAFEHGALWEAFVTVGITGLGIGFTFAAMPGFIIRSVPHQETGSATGFYQVLRNIGLSVGSALGAAVLLSFTTHGQIYPSLGGFRAVLLASAGFGVLTAILSFVLPGKGIAAEPMTSSEEHDLDVVLTEEAELAGAGFMLAEDHDPFEHDLEDR